jgi:dipeptidyl aminopeptidase/acylaminoacyl peptidase
MGKLHGIDIYARSPKDGIRKIGERALMVMHGTDDTRVPFLHSERLVKFANSIGKDVKFIVNNNSDHNEALLKEPELIRENLIEFFEKNLNN